ncbi:50S ribosomal protein L25 [Patescibacteria group bacterium]|nr:50S ribosomal protein L25 [Patescibacteria group bacterium]MDE1946367.1 50S ribosomal protein L25 [Patescibacteria group bacterium]MDE2010819.1 50S ribosomal protein L25 [Patescibacteria group bacterium]MDE2233121.1 50S ribosomal protein L25 [Patescibacteria group bacterium]
MLSLTVEKRDKAVGTGKADILRKAGKLPAVFYGPKEENTPITVDAKEFGKVLKKAGESSVIILKDGAHEHEALIHEVDLHPVTGEPRHADFYVIEKGKKVEVEVPLVFAGISPAVKDKGGILVKVMRELAIEAAPRDLPHEITVDISKLVELNDTVHAKDILLPKGVELKVNPEEVVASVSEAKEEVVETPAAIDMSAIEVETKGKEAKEDEGTAPAGETKPADAKKASETKK